MSRRCIHWKDKTSWKHLLYVFTGKQTNKQTNKNKDKHSFFQTLLLCTLKTGRDKGRRRWRSIHFDLQLDGIVLFEMSRLMPPNVNFSIKSVSTDITWKWANACMTAHVSQHIRGLWKDFATFGTFVWFLTSMHQWMFFQIWPSQEFLITDSTREWFHIQMD